MRRGRLHLCGDTVNTASRMESNGAPARIQVAGRRSGRGATLTRGGARALTRITAPNKLRVLNEPHEGLAACLRWRATHSPIPRPDMAHLRPAQMNQSTFTALTSSAPGVYSIEPRGVVDVKVLRLLRRAPACAQTWMATHNITQAVASAGAHFAGSLACQRAALHPTPCTERMLLS